MSDKYVINKSTLEGIGNAIRNKKGTSDLIPVSDLASEIASIPSGITPTGQIEITENGTFDVSSFASALVAVEGGGGDLPENWIMGEFTPQANLTEYSVSLSDNKNPIIALYFANDFYVNVGYMQKVGFAFLTSTSYISSASAFDNNNGVLNGMSLTYAGVSEMDAEHVKFNARGGNYTFKLGYTYTYLIIYGEE